MILLAFFFIGMVLRAIKRKKLLLNYSLIWLLVSFIIVVVAVFPGIFAMLTHLIGMEALSNFVFLIGIVVLMLFIFSLSIAVSNQTQRIKQIVQKVSIENYLNRQKEKSDNQA